MFWPSFLFCVAVLCGIILLYDPCGIIYTKTAKHKRRTKRKETKNPKPPWEIKKKKNTKSLKLSSQQRIPKGFGWTSQEDSDKDEVYELNETHGRQTYI